MYLGVYFALNHFALGLGGGALGPSCVGLLLQGSDTLRLSDTALSDRGRLN